MQSHNTLKDNLNDCWNQIGVWRSEAKRCPELDSVIHCRNCTVYSAAGRRLLDRDLPEQYIEEWTTILSQAKKVENSETKAAFVFKVGTEWLALSASLIREVVDMGTIHSIPHLSNNIIRGLVNIKGKLEICVSIGEVLGIDRDENLQSHTSYIAPERLVVVRFNNTILTFPVSEILGVLRYRPEMIRDLPVTVSGSKAAYTEGILCLENKDIGFLKTEQLFVALTRDLA